MKKMAGIDYARLVRYLFAGGCGAAVNLGIFIVLIHLTAIWYLAASVIAFSLSIVVSFLMQKYWTFRDRSNDRIHAQAALYFAITGLNLLINTLLIYLFVHYAHLHYIIAQIIASVLIAVESYFAYQRFIFEKSRL